MLLPERPKSTFCNDWGKFCSIPPKRTSQSFYNGVSATQMLKFKTRGKISLGIWGSTVAEWSKAQLTAYERGNKWKPKRSHVRPPPRPARRQTGTYGARSATPLNGRGLTTQNKAQTNTRNRTQICNIKHKCQIYHMYSIYTWFLPLHKCFFPIKI